MYQYSKETLGTAGTNTHTIDFFGINGDDPQLMIAVQANVISSAGLKRFCRVDCYLQIPNSQGVAVFHEYTRHGTVTWQGRLPVHMPYQMILEYHNVAANDRVITSYTLAKRGELS